MVKAGASTPDLQRKRVSSATSCKTEKTHTAARTMAKISSQGLRTFSQVLQM